MFIIPDGFDMGVLQPDYEYIFMLWPEVNWKIPCKDDGSFCFIYGA